MIESISFLFSNANCFIRSVICFISKGSFIENIGCFFRKENCFFSKGSCSIRNVSCSINNVNCSIRTLFVDYPVLKGLFIGFLVLGIGYLLFCAGREIWEWRKCWKLVRDAVVAVVDYDKESGETRFLKLYYSEEAASEDNVDMANLPENEEKITPDDLQK